MKKSSNAKTVRLLLTAALLILVWFNAHWSVALCLTLLTIAQELQPNV
jgi:hypothetical protein